MARRGAIEREAYGLEVAAYWRHVALAVARKTGRQLVVDTDNADTGLTTAD